MATRKQKPAAERRDGSAAGAAAKVDLRSAQNFAAAKLAGADVAEKFGHVSFSIGGKVFAFTRPNGLVLKLPPEVLREVVSQREAAPLVMGKRVMREWILLSLDGPEQYREELQLLSVAMKFVSLAKVET